MMASHYFGIPTYFILHLQFGLNWNIHKKLISSDHIITFVMSCIDNPETSACLLCSVKIRTSASLEGNKVNYCDDHVIHSVEDIGRNCVIKIKNQKNVEKSTASNIKDSISIKHNPASFSDLGHLNIFSWQRRKRWTFRGIFQQYFFDTSIRYLYLLFFLVLFCSSITPSNAIQPSQLNDNEKLSSHFMSNNHSHVSKARHQVLSSGDSNAKGTQLVGAEVNFGTPSHYKRRSLKPRKQRGNCIWIIDYTILPLLYFFSKS